MITTTKRSVQLVMLLIETSVWIDVFSDRTGETKLHQGSTVRSTIDCCIAQAAIDHQAVLIYNDRDFEAIAQVRSLQNLWFEA
jgi:predicted nuclease of predicted toxin-antitoxin system